MKKLLSLSFLVMFFAQSFLAFGSDTNLPQNRWCVDQDGALKVMEMLNKYHVPNGIIMTICEFRHENEGIKQVGTETLFSPHETLATRVFARKETEVPTEEVSPELFLPSPAAKFCHEQGGIYSNWRDALDHEESGFCTFADGSKMSDWTLFYGARNLPKLSKKFRYPL